MTFRYEGDGKDIREPVPLEQGDIELETKLHGEHELDCAMAGAKAQLAQDSRKINELNESLDYMHEAYEVLQEVLETECEQKIEELFGHILTIHENLDNSRQGDIEFRNMVMGLYRDKDKYGG